MLNRRRALTLGGLAAGVVGMAAFGRGQRLPDTAAAAGAPAPMSGMDMGGTSGGAVSAPSPYVAPFSVRMPVPRELRPVQRRPDGDVYELALRASRVEMLPGRYTTALTYGGTFVGPTIRARAGRPAFVRYTNRLDRPANAHLHGGHVPAGSDGYPMDLIGVGAQKTCHYPNRQPGATLWYHDHTHQLEAEHVYRGLHGFYLLEGDDEARLGLPSGEFDVPIMLSDAHFDAHGGLIYAAEDTPNRDTFLANGRPRPYFPVAARKYRFRILDASNFHTYHLDLGGAELLQIGSDGGLLPEPVSRREIVLSPGERAEVVIDFSRFRPGSQVVLNDVSGPVLRFDVHGGRADDHSRVPDVLRPLPPLRPGRTDREMTMSVDMVNHVVMINGRPYDENRVDTRVRRGATEIWHIRNLDADVQLDHNMHLHLVQFRILDRDGAPPLPGESGLKDTVLIPAGKSVRIQATFADYTGRYLYHCHMLEHSSAGMMAQLEVFD